MRPFLGTLYGVVFGLLGMAVISRDRVTEYRIDRMPLEEKRELLDRLFNEKQVREPRFRL